MDLINNKGPHKLHQKTMWSAEDKYSVDIILGQ